MRFALDECITFDTFVACRPPRDRLVVLMIAGQEILLLHGILKKSRVAPKQDIDLARKRRKLYLEANP